MIQETFQLLPQKVRLSTNQCRPQHIRRINRPIISTFVDNIKIIGAKNFGIISQVKEELTAAFEMINIGPISYFLDLKVS